MNNNNYINEKSESKFMKKIIIILTLFMMMFIPTFATEEGQQIYYRFETGTGSIAIDSSGNSYTGILDGMNFDNDISKLNTGIYSIKNSNDDAIIVSIPGHSFKNLSMFTSYYKENNAGLNTIFSLGKTGSSQVNLKYLDDGTPERFILNIRDSVGTLQTINLNNIGTGIIADNTKHKIGLVIDGSLKNIKFYLDGTLVHNSNYTFTLTNNLTIIEDVRIGEDYGNVDGMKGNLDDFRLFNLALNSSQINELQTLNTITLPEPETGGGTGGTNGTTLEPTINGTQQFDIINTYSPSDGENVTNIFSMSATLNVQASCETYIDNNYVSTNENVLAFTNQISGLSDGEHSYFLYCSRIDNNNILQYEITNTTTFFVEESTPSTINLIFQSSSLNLANYPLFVVTPCLTKSISIPLVAGSPYKMINNKGGVYFSPVVNGVSSFTLQEGNHDFCLINGVGQYNTENDYSNIWYVNQAEHQEILGQFSVPSNVTQNFVFSLDQSDIYSVTSPKWWNTSWIEIIGSLIGMILGLVLLFVGIQAKSGQIVLVGGLLVMFSLGYQVSNIVLGVLF